MTAGSTWPGGRGSTGVQLIGEILAVAVVARSLLTDRSGTTMVRAPRHQETRCAATR